MRPLTLSFLSGAASITFGIASGIFLTKLDLSSVTSPNTFTYLLIAGFCLLSSLACLWICLSYLLFAYIQRAHNHSSSLLSYAARLTIPHVRRHLLAAMTLSLLVAQPAYAQDYDSTSENSPVDISWGSPDLLEIAAHKVNDTNPLTSTPANSAVDIDDAQLQAEPPSHSLSPPQTSPPSSPAQNYTVKSGDTLWDITKAHLPPDSTDSDIAQACLAWSAANPALKNPNLIYPEQTLAIPQEYLS